MNNGQCDDLDDCTDDACVGGFCENTSTAGPCAACIDGNENGIADDCDITNGPSLDTNGNGVPDECETLAIPSLGEWGLVGLATLLIGAGLALIARRRRLPQPPC